MIWNPIAGYGSNIISQEVRNKTKTRNGELPKTYVRFSIKFESHVHFLTVYDTYHDFSVEPPSRLKMRFPLSDDKNDKNARG